MKKIFILGIVFFLISLSSLVFSNNIIIFTPINNTLHRENIIDFNFSFYNFSAERCDLYSNLTGDFIIEDSLIEIIEGNYSDDLMGFYRFEESSGNNATDSSLYNNNGNISGAIYNISKGLNETGNYSLTFDGINDYITLSSEVNISGIEETISFWAILKSDSVITLGRLNDNSYAGNFLGGFIYLKPNNSSIIYNYYAKAETGLGNTFNEWHFFVITRTGYGNNVNFYVDGIQKNTSYSGPIANNSFTPNIIGSGDDMDYFFNGSIDEISFWNIALNNSEILDIYNNGISKIPSENFTLEQNTNYTLNVNIPDNLKTDTLFYINCFNNDDINSSFILLDLNTDFTPPIINVLFPDTSYNETYNFNIWINFTTNEISNCSLNNTDFNLIYSNNTYFSFYETVLSNNFYNVEINCSDILNNSVIKNIYFTKDEEYPNIIIYSPLLDNSSIFIVTDYILQKFFLEDNNDLYFVEINISLNFSDELVYYEHINLSGTSYYYLKNLNVENWTFNQYYKESIRFCDSHTNSDITFANTIIKKSNSLKFEFEETNIEIKSISGFEKSTDSKKLYDRYTFEFYYTDKSDKRIYELSSNKHIDYLDYSKYKAHFIINNKYWVDFENKNNVEVKYLGNNTYNIFIYDNLNDIILNSVGELNCKTVEFTFLLKDIIPEKTLTDVFDFTNIIILYTFFIFIQLILLYFGLYFKLGFLLFLSPLMGILISISFIKFVSINLLFQNFIIVYIFINVLFMFLSAKAYFGE